MVMYDSMTGDASTLRDRIAEHVAEIFRLLSLDPERDPELEGTPHRVADLALELASAALDLPVVQPLAHCGSEHGLVVVRDLRFQSYCAHHLLPFFGLAHIGYEPGETLPGIGVPGRILDHFSQRPQLQERLGEQVADYLFRELDALGVIVVIEARQLCVEMRGARRSASIETTAARGTLVSGDSRREFFDRLGARRGGGRDDGSAV
jgi:GTP cyclohydrolase IA